MRTPVLSILASVVLGCSGSAGTAAVTRLTIDTDLPTPEIASHLRIDLYREDGTWFASRDVVTDQPSAFPASFDLAAPTSGSVTVRVRLRVYPDTYTRDYRGERFSDWPDVLGATPAETDGLPRLEDDADTPEFEPLPAVTVDRLVELTATAGQSDTRNVVLRGVCAGYMANLATGESCASEPGRVPLASADPGPGTASHQNDLRESCDGVDVGAGRICVPGGVFVLGERNQVDYDKGEFLDARPERLVRVRRFALDENEISVGRYRSLSPRLHEYARYEPAKNDGLLGNDPTKPAACTYTTNAGDRESYPLNCLPWGAFRQLCELEGGDLPTEAQWEYAASQAGSAHERRYPWSDDAPTCDRAVYARVGSKELDYCTAIPALVALDDPAGAADVSPIGIRSLGGFMSEYVQDAPASYLEPAWTDLGFDDPRVENPVDPAGPATETQRFVGRGGSWASPANTLRASFRLRVSAASPFYGARCAYPLP